VPIATKPLLMVDVDGVLSLFGPGRDLDRPRDGAFHSIEGIPHFLSASAATHLLALADLFELVWASGWEERADDHLPHLLGIPAGLPFLRLDRGGSGRRAAESGRTTAGHWKLEAITAYARDRPLAWIDDALDAECHAWAAAREAPTLLVQTEPEHGLTDREARLLSEWARQLASR
jgi:hypothetical protein